MTSSTSVAIPRLGETVQTRSGRKLTLTERLGCGGQGAVFRTDDPARAVKVCWRVEDVMAWQRRIERAAFLQRELTAYPGVRRFVLPRELLASPWLGYEMPLLPEARPVAELTRLPRTRPEAAYLESGGLKRRLGISVRIARAISALHSAGFVFGDLSANNVLTAVDRAHSTIRIIDCDNIDVAGSDGTGMLGTPGYWAPELVTHRARPDAASDDHALAVLMHELLYLVHPLRGDQLLEQDPDQAERLLEQGQLPWIFDPQNESNRTSAGLPLQYAAAADTTLFKRFQEAFGEGLRDRTKRPTAAALQEAAERLLRLCRTCRSCQGTEIYRKQTACIWCGAALDPPLLLQIEPDETTPVFRELRDARKSAEQLRQIADPSHATEPLPILQYRKCVVEDGLVLTEVLLRPWRSNEDDEVPIGRVRLNGDLIQLTIEKDCGLRHGTRKLSVGSTARLAPGDSLSLPGEGGKPSCRLLLLRPRREAT